MVHQDHAESTVELTSFGSTQIAIRLGVHENFNILAGPKRAHLCYYLSSQPGLLPPLKPPLLPPPPPPALLPRANSSATLQSIIIILLA